MEMKTMSDTEELVEAIYNLSARLEEITDDTSKFPLATPSPLERLTGQLNAIESQLSTLTDYLGDLTNVMEDILKVQKKAMKWQEMFG